MSAATVDKKFSAWWDELPPRPKLMIWARAGYHEAYTAMAWAEIVKRWPETAETLRTTARSAFNAHQRAQRAARA